VNTTKNKFSSVARWVALLALVLGFAASGAWASVRWATLEAIHQLENPHDLPTPGPCGELGAYQFRAATWRMHTTLPFARAIERQASDDVAVKHYEWLKRGLENAGLRATPYNIALAWNGGLDAVVLGRAPTVAHHYAERAANLAGSFGAERVASNR
jgi:hypothetical protein